MPASLPPPPPPRPPGHVARVRELLLVLGLTPIVVGVVSRWGPLPEDEVTRALATGAIYLVVPCLFGVMVLAITQTVWAGWIALSLEVSLLGLLAGADAFFQHTLSLRAAITLTALGWTAIRLRSWGRNRKVSLRSLPGVGGG